MSRWSQDIYIKSIRFAAQAHQGQFIPGSDLPYVVHLSIVAMEVMAALDAEKGRNEDMAVQCALLHDVIEDTGTTFDQVKLEFGDEVARGVSALSKDEALPKAQRLSDSLRRIRQQPQEIWMVKLADRITNLQMPPGDWNGEKIARYRDDAIEIHDQLKDASPFLAARLASKIQYYQAFI